MAQDELNQQDSNQENPEVTENAEPVVEAVAETVEVSVEVPEEKAPVKKKVEKLSLKEVEERLVWIEKKMGKHPNSRYVQHLLMRKQVLSKNS